MQRPDIYDELVFLRAGLADAQRAIAEIGKRSQVRTWYSLDQAAAYLSVSTTTLYDLRSSGRLRTHHINSKPVFHVDDLDALAVPSLD